MKKNPCRVMSLLTTFSMVCAILLSVPVLVEAANSLPIKVEAEDCTLSNGASVATKIYNDPYPGYSGDGFVWVSNAGTITLNVTVPENAMYELSTRCWMYLGELDSTRMQSIDIDGTVHTNFYIPNKGDWMDYSFGYYYLEAGTTTINIGSTGSWGFIIYDTITFDYANLPKLTSDRSLSDKNATAEAESLNQYLNKVYGNHVISGQQEIYGGGNDGDSELEFDYILDKTGKLPAIRGFDLMNYNPLYGWEDGTTSRIIEWVNERGGIATASWHINVPVDFTSYSLGDSLDWTNCTYKPSKTFDTSKCLDKTSKEYSYLMLAIDDLAEQLLLLQEANVPLLFRPFHEAEGYNNTDGSGAWFWWGSAGSEVYKQLWKLLYETLTQEYGLHNLIWEVNLYTYASSLEWYPGDDCVDIVAYDKYEGSPHTWNTSAATTVFLSLVDYTSNKKMVALTENDIIPDIKNIVNEGAWWLYFCPWYGEFLMIKNDPVMLKSIYTSDYVVTLDELPANLYNSQAITPTPTPAAGIVGDLNSDNKFDALDFAQLRKYLLSTVPDNLTNGDVDGNQKVDALDFACMRKKLLGMISKFPVE